MGRIKKIHFTGICGTAMASLAAMMKARGFSVAGSDRAFYPPMGEFLEEKGIPIMKGYSASNLDWNPDLVVIGNALSRGNEEVEEVLKRNIPYTSSAELLREYFIRGKRSVVVSGTHGKSTTTALLCWILEKASLDPSFFIGGISINYGSGYKIGSGGLIVVEGDEYDTAFFDKRPKFLHYMPNVMIITNIEFDHADIYKDLEEVMVAFRKGVRLLPNKGRLIINNDDAGARLLIPAARCPVVTCGLKSRSDWIATVIRIEGEITLFEVRKHGRYYGAFRWALPGHHNLSNALTAMAAADLLGIGPEPMAEALATFKGVKRRLEKTAEIRGIRLYDDFAHHPSEVRESLKALRSLRPKGRIWAIFEPRSNTSRRCFFQREYSWVFKEADYVIISQVYRAEGIDECERLDAERLARDVNRKGRANAFYIPSVDEIVTFVVPRLKEGDLVVTMSNGDFDGLQQRLINALSRLSDDR